MEYIYSPESLGGGRRGGAHQRFSLRIGFLVFALDDHLVVSYQV